MSPSWKSGNPDANQNDIVKVLRKLGAKVLIITRIPNSFDILVFYKGQCLPVEVKTEKGKLTKGEEKFKEEIEARGVKYNIVRNINDAIKLLDG